MKRTLILALSTLLSVGTFAQNKTCGTAILHNEIMQNDADKRALYEQLERFTQEYVKNHANDKSGATYIIPTVFHVIHNYGNERIGKAQILDAVRIMNEDFRGFNADTNQVAPAFKSIIADSEIEFRLATLDPNGACTEGITYTQSELTFVADNKVKDLVNWDTKKYLNVWVVDRIASGAGGYSYYPGGPPLKYEGIVCTHRQCGGIGTSGGSNFSKRTMTHECGHYLNLPHTWGSTNQVAVPNNCSLDDGVSDTPNTEGSPQSCDINQNTCNSLDNVHNYMDYSSCSKMFTNGQKLRMHAALNSGAGWRNNLWISANLIATGTDSAYVAACGPIVDFASQKTVYCVGDSVQLLDYTYNNDVDASWVWNWTFTGGSPASSNLQNPKVAYHSPGQYNITLQVTNANGTDVLTRNALVTIVADSTGVITPFFEGFESASFPAHGTDPLKDWTIEAPSSNTWTRTTAAGFFGSSASIRINPASVPTGEKHSLLSPVVQIDSVNNEELRFRVAFSRPDTNDKSYLKVYISSDCGHNWQVRYVAKANGTLPTVPIFINPPFVPNGWDWREEVVYLTGMQGKKYRFKFEFEDNGTGNHLYLDHINLGGHPLGLKEQATSGHASVFPNPSNGNPMLSFEAVQDEITLTVFGISGQLLGNIEKNGLIVGKSYQQSIADLTGKLSAGFYMVKISSANGSAHSIPFIVR